MEDLHFPGDLEDLAKAYSRASSYNELLTQRYPKVGLRGECVNLPVSLDLAQGATRRFGRDMDS